MRNTVRIDRVFFFNTVLSLFFFPELRFSIQVLLPSSPPSFVIFNFRALHDPFCLSRLLSHYDPPLLFFYVPHLSSQFFSQRICTNKIRSCHAFLILTALSPSISTSLKLSKKNARNTLKLSVPSETTKTLSELSAVSGIATLQ